MKHSTGTPTVVQKKRFVFLKEMGCIACLLDLHYWKVDQCGPPEIHHLLSGNRRRGHDFTIPLGAFHHRGEPPLGMTATQATMAYGPSLARASRKFRERYGDDDSLLAIVNQRLESP